MYGRTERPFCSYTRGIITGVYSERPRVFGYSPPRANYSIPGHSVKNVNAAGLLADVVGSARREISEIYRDAYKISTHTRCMAGRIPELSSQSHVDICLADGATGAGLHSVYNINRCTNVRVARLNRHVLAAFSLA